MWHPLSDSLKQKYGEDQEVHVIYEDQAWNDWKSVFLRIHGELDVGVADRTDDNFQSVKHNYYMTSDTRSLQSILILPSVILINVSFLFGAWRPIPFKFQNRKIYFLYCYFNLQTNLFPIGFLELLLLNKKFGEV